MCAVEVTPVVSTERLILRGPVVTDARGLLQWIDVRTLLPPSFRELLFKETVDDRWASPG